MSATESEHGLRIQLAAALRERDEQKARAESCFVAMTLAQDRATEAEQALAAANARADAAEAAAAAHQEARIRLTRERNETHDALAAARREIEDSRRVIFMLVTQSGGEVVIGRNVIIRLDDVRATIETSRDPGGDLRIRAALAAPADGEETKR